MRAGYTWFMTPRAACAAAAENDAQLGFWLGQIPTALAGAAVIIAVRAGDNMLIPGEYTLQDPLEPGDSRRRDVLP
jgi:hypothetical protein